MLGVRQWRHVAFRHGAFCVSRQPRLCRRWPGRIFMYYSWKAVLVIHRLWNNVYHRLITNNFPCKWHRTACTSSACKSSLRKILHWNSSGEPRLKFISERIEEDSREVENIATTNVYRGRDKILQLHRKRNRWREGTPTADASKSDETGSGNA